MNDPTESVIIQPVHRFKECLKRLAHVDDDGQAEFFGPCHLPFKGLVLDGQGRFVPVQVESDFTHRHIAAAGVAKCTFNGA